MHTKFTGRWEVSCLVLNLLIYRMFTSVSGLFTSEAGSGASLSALCAGVIAVGLIFLLLTLYKKCSCGNMAELAEKIFGKIGAKLVEIVFIIYLLFSSAFMLRDFSLFVRMAALPTAPLWFSALLIVVPSAFAAYMGFDAIIRTHVVTVPVVILLTLAVLLSVFGFAEADNLFPLLGNGYGSVFSGSFKGLLLFSDIILLFMVNPFADAERKNIKNVLAPAVGGIILTVAAVVIFTATTAYPYSQTIRFPIYQLLKMVYYGRFFQRIDSVYMLTVMISGMLYLATAICLVSRLGGQVCKIRGKHILQNTVIAAVSIVCFVMALSFDILDENRMLFCIGIAALIAVAITYALGIGNIIRKSAGRNNEC